MMIASKVVKMDSKNYHLASLVWIRDTLFITDLKNLFHQNIVSLTWTLWERLLFVRVLNPLCDVEVVKVTKGNFQKTLVAQVLFFQMITGDDKQQKIDATLSVNRRGASSHCLYRRPSLYAVFLSAISCICDWELAIFLEPIL